MPPLPMPLHELVVKIATNAAERDNRRCYYCLQLILFESVPMTVLYADGSPMCEVEVHPGCAAEIEAIRQEARRTRKPATPAAPADQPDQPAPRLSLAGVLRRFREQVAL